MKVSVTTSAYGADAHTALALAVEQTKAGDRLAPVSVIVPSNHVGIAARRALGRRGGVAAVTFLTPYGLADLLGEPGVAASGRIPVSTPVLAGAVRSVLQDDPGHFAGVHTHPTTVRSLIHAHRALSEVSLSGLRQLETVSKRTADVVRIHRQVARRLHPRFSDEQHLVAAAIEALTAGTPVLHDLGPAILFLPQPLTSSQRRLLRAFAKTSSLSVIMGVTGAADADAPVAAAIRAVGGTVTPKEVPVPFADEALSVSDADDEVRHAVRAVIDASLRGEPLGGCAILYGSADPYGRLIADALNAADIPWFGASVRNAESSLLGRCLLGLLALPDHNLSRHDVAAWLASAPVRGIDNRPAPVVAWERATRAAGVVAGAEQWHDRLVAYIGDLEAEAEMLDDSEQHHWQAALRRREADYARQLDEFINTLSGALTPRDQETTWAGLATWCRQLVRSYIGDEGVRGDWPNDEQAAAQRIDAAIDRLGDLDGIDPEPSAAAFQEALEVQLADDRVQHGRFGSGVLVGPVALAIGVELDTVVVVGMAEGSLPKRRPEDPLLSDRARARIGPDLPLHADAIHDDHRALLAVMAAASRVLFTFPRGDLRRGAERSPSRWLLDTIEARDAVRPGAEDLGRLTGDWLTEVPSFISGLRATDFPASEQEYDVRALLDHAEAGGDIGTLALVDERIELRRGIDLLSGRLSPDFTRFDGNLGAGNLRGVQLPQPTAPGHVTSTTRLEMWASCPHAYFVRHVLGVNPVANPEVQYRISPLVKGSLVHGVLEQWIKGAIETGTVPRPGAAWSPDALATLASIAKLEADHLEQRGMVGRRLYWGRDRQVILSDLESFPEFDQQQRAAHGSHPIATELEFGMRGSVADPVELPLPDGRGLRLRGAIDRIDETTSGELIVIDYKTGSNRNYSTLSADDPTPGGAHLQLVLFSLAACLLLSRQPSSTRGSYWFASRKGEFTTAGYPITDEVQDQALATIVQIVDGIEAGSFPAHPVETSMFSPGFGCSFCEPDGLGVSHQNEDWLRMQDAPELAPYLALIAGGHD